MAEAIEGALDEEMLDVRRAAALLGRHPETIRRWVWSGRVPARRQGNRLLIARADVEAAAGRTKPRVDLSDWAERARAARSGTGASSDRSGAADLVLENRTARS